jgi:hypothetical protein
MTSSLEIVPWSCHICHSAFSETQGGLCRSCGQATCRLCWGIVRASSRADRLSGNAENA